MAIVIVDLEAGKAYSNLSKTQAAKLVGLSRVTIHRWSKAQRWRKVYKHFEIYFKPEHVKRTRKAL